MLFESFRNKSISAFTLSRDKHNWKSITNKQRSSILQNFKSLNLRGISNFISVTLNGEKGLTEEPPLSWKQLYLIQHLENKPSSTDIKTSKWYENLPIPKKVYRIPVLGDGLETSAKTLIYKLMWSADSPFKLMGLHPGVMEGIGSGVGFTVNKKDLNLCAIYYQGDRSLFDEVKKPLWREFFKGSSGLIFVMDNSKSLDKVKAEIDLFLNDSNNIPLLILACDQGEQNAKPVAISDLLGLNNDRTWKIQTVNVETMEGIKEALLWLSTQV